MFEEEAKEYFECECMHSYADTEEQLKEDVVAAFQNGAEFAYKKAKEEDKWHYVKDGDLPKESTSVLTLSSDNSLNECIYIPNEGFKDTVFSTWYYPVAWKEKELVLPKLKEE